MKDIAELRQRLEDTKEGETICLDHEDATLILKQFEDLEERIAPLRDVESRKCRSRTDEYDGIQGMKGVKKNGTQYR